MSHENENLDAAEAELDKLEAKIKAWDGKNAQQMCQWLEALEHGIDDFDGLVLEVHGSRVFEVESFFDRIDVDELPFRSRIPTKFHWDVNDFGRVYAIDAHEKCVVNKQKRDFKSQPPYYVWEVWSLARLNKTIDDDGTILDDREYIIIPKPDDD